MRVIHGVWAHGALCLWAEDPDLPPVPDTELAGRAPSDVHLPRPHPFARQAAELADMPRGPAGARDAVRKAVHDELTLQLPTAGGGPLASPELIRPEAPGTPGAPRPSGSSGRAGAAGCRWLAGGYPCSPSARRLRSRSSMVRGWPVPGRLDEAAISGGSLVYLVAVARFAVGLAARGRVLPALEAESGGYAARWRPVLGGATRSAPAIWPRPCPRPAGRSPGRPPECCSAAPWMPWPTPPPGTGCPPRCCPRGAAAPRRACRWPNGSCSR